MRPIVSFSSILPLCFVLGCGGGNTAAPTGPDNGAPGTTGSGTGGDIPPGGKKPTPQDGTGGSSPVSGSGGSVATTGTGGMTVTPPDGTGGSPALTAECTGTAEGPCPLYRPGFPTTLMDGGNLNHACALDVSNARLVWIESDTVNGTEPDCKNYGGRLRFMDMRAPNPVTLATGHVTAPSISEDGRIGYLTVDVAAGCSTTHVMSADHKTVTDVGISNCGAGTVPMLPQLNTSRFRGTILLVSMLKNDSLLNRGTWYWDGTNVVQNPMLQDQAIFPSLHGMSLTFQPKGIPSSAWIYDIASQKQTESYLQPHPGYDIVASDFNASRFISIERMHNDTDTQARVVNRSDQSGMWLGTPGYPERPQINSVGSVMVWKEDATTIDYVGGANKTIKINFVRDFILDGRDIYMFSDDGAGGHDIVWVIRVIL